MRSIAPWRYTTLSQVFSQSSSTTSTSQRLTQRFPGWIRLHRYGAFVLVRCGTRRWACQKSAIFTTVHSGAIRISEPETNFSLSWRRVCYQLSLLSHEQVRRNPCTNQVQICLKNGNQVATWKMSKSGFSLKDKKSKFSLVSEPKFTNTSSKPILTERSIQEFTRNIDSQRMEIDHTVAGCEQSRRDQLLLHEELSDQNRALRETCIKKVGDMEELQESHVLKVDELSRRKLTEDFEAVTSFFQGSNVKTVYNLGDNDAMYPDAEIDDVHTRNSLASPLYLRSEKQVRACCRLSLRKRKLVSTCTVKFFISTEKPVTWCHKKAQI